MLPTPNIHLTETPRDAMQGFGSFISSEKKAQYINLLLRSGFETVDVGSFVSPKAVPQMADTSQVLSNLVTDKSNSKLMVLAANMHGAVLAAKHTNINIISYPYSVSETFLKRNLNTDKTAAWQTILSLHDLAKNSGKQIRVYVSMAFGNPYGDSWDTGIVSAETSRLLEEGITDVVYSDITGEANPTSVRKLFTDLKQSFPGFNPGIHLHTKAHDWEPKVEAAWDAGVRCFESALGGYGGCPMTGYELLGNLDTLNLLRWCKKQRIETGIDNDILAEAKAMAGMIFQ